MLGGGGVPVKSIQPRPLALFAICPTKSYLGVASTAAKMATTDIQKMRDRVSTLNLLQLAVLCS